MTFWLPFSYTNNTVDFLYLRKTNFTTHHGSWRNVAQRRPADTSMGMTVELRSIVDVYISALVIRASWSHYTVTAIPAISKWTRWTHCCPDIFARLLSLILTWRTRHAAIIHVALVKQAMCNTYAIITFRFAKGTTCYFYFANWTCAKILYQYLALGGCWLL